MVSTVVERYFAATLHIVFSEIAYYRYLFPDSFFKIVDYENVKVHALIRGKSIESDQLLTSVDGACDAMAHGCLKTLVIGLSIHPTKHTFIRELYAFQFGYGSDYKTFKGRSTYSETTELFLQRLTALLREMEVLALPISMSMRMTLTASAPPNYKPPGFTSFMTKDIESYAIYPRCGSARVGKASKGKSSMFMCALCVEGPVQTPPLGYMLCSMPMTLDVDEDRQEVVFVAVPSWHSSSQENAVVTLPLQQIGNSSSGICEVATPTTQIQPEVALRPVSTDNRQNAVTKNHLRCECLDPKSDDPNIGAQWVCIKCNRHCHNVCYGLAEIVSEPHALCLTCRLRKARIAGDVVGIRRLAKIRKTLFIAHMSCTNTLLWLTEQTLCKRSMSRRIIGILEKLGLLKVDRSARPPLRYTTAVVGDLSAVPLFSEDIRQVWTAVAEV
ncbi:hypothetical protein GGI17_002231 [Coemansia sp. S146]|nr:hypothetical protein GGI17_002231 [Coemansia sp. S146]